MNLIYLNSGIQVQQQDRALLFETLGTNVVIHRDTAAQDCYFKSHLEADLWSAQEVFPKAYIKAGPSLEKERSNNRSVEREEEFVEDKDDILRGYCDLD